MIEEHIAEADAAKLAKTFFMCPIVLAHRADDALLGAHHGLQFLIQPQEAFRVILAEGFELDSC